jgi:hypothetical protein
MKIDESDEQLQKAHASILTKVHSRSKLMLTRDEHAAKQLLGIDATEEGRQRDESGEQWKNAEFPMAQS